MSRANISTYFNLRVIFGILLFAFLLPTLSFGQHYYRLKADFSFKFKDSGADETASLVMGTAYFDKLDKKITYRVKFPKPEVWVMHDTSLYKFEGKTLLERSYIPSPVEASIFNLALQSSMNNFALESSAYKLEKVEEENGLVIATWIPPKMKGERILGKVLIANRNGLLQGIVFQNWEGEVISKQFYNDYTWVSGINFPREVTQIMYEGEKESYQVTNYKNIIIDESGEDHWYRYPVNGVQ